MVQHQRHGFIFVSTTFPKGLIISWHYYISYHFVFLIRTFLHTWRLLLYDKHVQYENDAGDYGRFGCPI